VEHFGEKLRRLRGDTPQKEVAEALDIPQTTLSGLEKQSSIPRGDILKKLADYFGVAIEYFYDAPEFQPSRSAKAWLEHLQTNFKGSDAIAAHSDDPVDEALRKKILHKIRKNNAKTSNKD
jgi:transcriptional regulator with XRE-family HTH domain